MHINKVSFDFMLTLNDGLLCKKLWNKFKFYCDCRSAVH